MILRKIEKGAQSIKGHDTCKPLFYQADADKDGKLNFEEW